jgi:hypothetical protein
MHPNFYNQTCFAQKQKQDFVDSVNSEFAGSI